MVNAKRTDDAVLKDFEKSVTQQQFKDEVDINLIVARAEQGQTISHVNERVAKYGDFSAVLDYQAALDLINRATGMFMSLDAVVRERFANDPGKMVAFLGNSANYDEGVKLGLVVPRPVVPPVEPPVVEGSDSTLKIKNVKKSEVSGGSAQ